MRTLPLLSLYHLSLSTHLCCFTGERFTLPELLDQRTTVDAQKYNLGALAIVRLAPQGELTAYLLVDL